MLSDEVQSKAIQLTYKGLAITAKLIKELIVQYAMRPEQQVYGKQSLRRLNRKNRALENIPVSGVDLQGLQRELRRYGVDYAVTARKAEPGTFDIFFKGNDINQIQTSLKTYAWSILQRQQRMSILERMRTALDKAQRQSRTAPRREVQQNFYQTP